MPLRSVTGATLNHLCTMGRCVAAHFDYLGRLLNKEDPISFAKTYLLLYLDLNEEPFGDISVEDGAQYRSEIKAATTIDEVDIVARCFMTASFFNPQTGKSFVII